VGLYTRTFKRLGHTKAFAIVFKRVAPPADRLVYKLTGGRRVLADGVLPTLILVHRGHRSGREYRTPLSYIRLGERFGLAGSNFGQLNHPGWSANLIANSDCSVEIGGQTIPMRARHVSDDEKEKLWPRFVDIWPAYNTYRSRAAHRNIRVFVLEPRT
jgi:deazaflavin-dependent oxidoreductase (nitroreductase family)